MYLTTWLVRQVELSSAIGELIEAGAGGTASRISWTLRMGRRT